MYKILLEFTVEKYKLYFLGKNVRLPPSNPSFHPESELKSNELKMNRIQILLNLGFGYNFGKLKSRLPIIHIHFSLKSVDFPSNICFIWFFSLLVFLYMFLYSIEQAWATSGEHIFRLIEDWKCLLKCFFSENGMLKVHFLSKVISIRSMVLILAPIDNFASNVAHER